MPDYAPTAALKLWNLVQFQLGWFALVLTAAAGAPVIGGLVLAGLVAMHLRLCPSPRAEALMLCGLAALGWLWESTLVAAGLLAYPGQAGEALVAPWWLAALWLNFGTSLNYCLRWLRGRWWLCAVFGAVGGPLAFVAGQALGAVTLTGGSVSVMALSIGWLVLMPLASALAAVTERYGMQSLPAGQRGRA